MRRITVTLLSLLLPLGLLAVRGGDADSARMDRYEPGDTTEVTGVALAAGVTDNTMPMLSLESPVTEPSPEATAMTRHRDEGVDYSTGTASFGIPLFTWEVGDHVMELSLGYRIGPYTVDDTPGWFGLGWNLEGTGCVTRRIMGLPDEKFKQEIRGASGIDSDPESYRYLRDLHEYRKDDALDRYSYACPAGRGSFFIKDGVIIPAPQTDNEITFTGETADGVRDFMITSPDGTRYIFAGRELIDFEYKQETLGHRKHIPPYQNAVSTWYLSKIITPEGADTITVTYDEIPRWSRDRTSRTRTSSFTYVGQNGLSEPDRGLMTLVDRAVTTFHNQKIIKRIESRTATVDFTHVMIDKPSDNDARASVTGMTVKSPDGTAVRDITIGLSASNSRYPDHVVIRSQGVTIDRHDFSYSRIGRGSGSKDFFGYFNGSDGSCPTVIDPEDGTFNESHRPKRYQQPITGAMTTHKTIQGLHTRYDFENSSMEYVRRNGAGNPADTLTLQIGMRLKTITTVDSVTGRRRTREFSYSRPMCDIDFDRVSSASFVSISGVTAIRQLGPMHAEARYTTAVTFHDTSIMPGFPIHEATIYYGTVEERVSGTGIEYPVLTRYEYDTTPCRMTFIPCSGNQHRQAGLIQPHPRFMHTAPVPRNVSEGVKKAMQSAPCVNGGFRENIGARPLLIAVTGFSGERGAYTPLTERRMKYVTVGRDSLVTGVFHQSLVRDKIDIYGNEKSDFQSSSDFNYGNTTVRWSRALPDSVTTTRIFPDGSKRISGTRYIYTSDRYLPTLRPAPGGGSDEIFELDSFIVKPYPGLPQMRCPFRADTITSQAFRHTLFGTRTTAGGHTTEHYVARAQNVSSGFYSGAVSRGRRSLPVREIWVVDGRDTITRSFGYGVFNGVTRLTSTELTGRGGALMDRIRTGGYTTFGRPTSVMRMGKPVGRYEWGYAGDLPVSVTVGEDGGPQLHSQYIHIPLVGCIVDIAPDGLRTHYAYRGGQLSVVMDNRREMLTRYDYRRYGDYASGGYNRVVTTSYIDGQTSTPAVTESVTDGFGYPVASLSRDFGSEGDVLTSLTRYDALHRRLREWRPVPVTDAGSVMRTDAPMSAAAMALYSDSLAFSSTVYPASASELAAKTVLPGSDLHYNATSSELTTSTTQMRDYARAVERYRFDGTKVVPDGYYLRGELDCVRSTDAEGHTTLTFTDVLGRTVLVRRLTGSYSYADTYTISDSWGNPLVVLPPEASAGMGGVECRVDEEPLHGYAYIYTYDDALRLRSMKVPGREAVEYAYDSEGRVIFTRDGNQRLKGERTFILRDELGRDAVTGICDDALSDDIWERDLSASTPPLTASLTASIGSGFLSTGYTTGTDTGLSNARLLQATYYDGESFLPASHPARALPSTGLDSPKGHVTGTLTAMLTDGDRAVSDDGERVLTLHSYDRRGFLSRTARYLPDGRTLLTQQTNTVAGLPAEQTVTLSQADSVIAETVTANTYDAFGRLVRTRLSPGTPDERVVYEAETDATGQTATERMATVERSTVRDIRGAVASWSTPWISQRLTRAYPGRIAGKITAMADGTTRRYGYTYSDLGFLTSATFTSSADPSKDYSSSYTYDLHGNITSMRQEGISIPGVRLPSSRLDFEYDGNRMASFRCDAVNLLSLPFEGEIAIPGEPGELSVQKKFGYDADGNLTLDPLRRLDEITYNAIDRPCRIVTASADTVTSIYSAAGEKLAETYRSHDGLSDLRRDFIGPYELTDGRLTRTNLAGGFIDTLGTIHAYIPDYQGNIVAVVNCDTDTLEQFTDYYPYGQPHPDCTGPELSRRKFGGKEMLTEFRLNGYDFEARRLVPLTGRFTQPDPFGFLTPETSPYAYCAADPVNHIDPLGLYSSQLDALDDLRKLFPDFVYDPDSGVDFPIHQDNKTQEWFISLNETGDAPYTGGSVVTRSYGSFPATGFWISDGFFYTNFGGGAGQSPPMPFGQDGGGGWSKFVTATSAYGVGNDVKLFMIDSTAKMAVGKTPTRLSDSQIVDKALGKTIGNYARITRVVSRGCTAITAVNSICEVATEYRTTQKFGRRSLKAGIDFAMAAISFCGPVGTCISIGYSIIDTSTNGKWFDYICSP